MRVEEGDDFGWPYCYYGVDQRRRCWRPSTAATAGRSAAAPRRKSRVIAFPAHWAPLALAFYRRRHWAPATRDGAFVAFHGSWNRAPLPQAGYRVVFAPLRRRQGDAGST